MGNGMHFLRTFGPTWQSSMMRTRFSNSPDIARAKRSYQAPPSSIKSSCLEAAEDNEISFGKGDKIEITDYQGQLCFEGSGRFASGYWMQGTLKDGSSGFFRSKDVDTQMKNVFKRLV